jgi:hypothetical protein
MVFRLDFGLTKVTGTEGRCWPRSWASLIHPKDGPSSDAELSLHTGTHPGELPATRSAANVSRVSIRREVA